MHEFQIIKKSLISTITCISHKLLNHQKDLSFSHSFHYYIKFHYIKSKKNSY